uniref:Uncharacterized protein n=1 Tax=Meloidogyne floridensis TaxID=298350 RepID=A0A915PF08_9BILA
MGIQRDVKEEKEALINQINSIANIVDQEAEGFKDLTWNSFPEQVKKLVLMKKMENQKCYISDLNGMKLAGISVIVGYVQEKSNNHLSEDQETTQKNLENLIKTFKILDNLKFTNGQKEEVKNMTTNVVDELIKSRNEINSKIKEIKIQFLTGLSVKKFEELKNKIEKIKEENTEYQEILTLKTQSLISYLNKEFEEKKKEILAVNIVKKKNLEKKLKTDVCY